MFANFFSERQKESGYRWERRLEVVGRQRGRGTCNRDRLLRKENLSSINKKKKNKEIYQGRDELEGSGGECPMMGGFWVYHQDLHRTPPYSRGSATELRIKWEIDIGGAEIGQRWPH